MSDTAEAIAQARKAVEPDKPKHVLRTLGQSIREYKKASILAPVFVTVEGILEILIPTIMASLIDEGITGGSMPATVKFGVILLVCSMVSLGAGFLSGKYAAVAGAGFAKNLRKDQFEKVQGFSFTNIDRFSTGSIVTRLTTDVTNPAERLHDDHSSGRACPDYGGRYPGCSRSVSPRRFPWCSWPASRFWPSACAVWPCSCIRCSSACFTPTMR